MPKTLPIELVRSLWRYEPDTGKVYWIVNASGFVRAGSEAGKVQHHRDGRRVIRYRGSFYYAHRIAWALHYGAWPPPILDHINGIPDDNRIANLRSVTDCQNVWNRALVARGASNIPGVSLEASGRYAARIGHQKKLIALGTFATAEEASAAYQAKVVELRGEYRRRNG